MVSASDALLRVFVDSSILMAGSLSAAGSARDLLLAGVRGEVVLLVSPLVLEETERNLYKKAPQGLSAFHEFRQLLEEHLVDPPKELVVEVAQHIEFKDAPIVAGAIRAQAPYLVSYDRRHLLKHADLIRQLYQIEAITPDILVARLQGI
jgi:predicted nucleic acid-binding protein